MQQGSRGRGRSAVAVGATSLVVGVLGVVWPASATGAAVPGAAVAGSAVDAAADLRCDPGERGCDSDGDRISDTVEQVVCGSITCATGHEDADGDGLPDWVEYLASTSTTAVDPAADVDGDGMPDFAERLVCGSDRCATGREDVDGDGARDWAEVVICGDVTCATGREDYDGNGTPDADELQACVVYDRGDWWARLTAPAARLATTGVAVGWVLVVAVAAVTTGAWLRRRAVGSTPVPTQVPTQVPTEVPTEVDGDGGAR